MSFSRLATKPVFEETIKKQETHKYYPQTKSFEYNDTVEVPISQQDVFVDFSESTLELECQCTESATGVGTPTLTNNVGAFLFSNVAYELNNHIVQNVREPGLVSAIRNFLTLTPSESKALTIAGWTPFDSVTVKNGRFYLSIPLSYLFSVFADSRTPLIGKHVFRLTRAANDNNCYQIARPAPTAQDAAPVSKTLSITIVGLALKVLHIHPNEKTQLALMTRIQKEEPFVMAFRNWPLTENPNLARSRQDLWPVKTLSGTERPRYIILALQTDVKSNVEKDASKFDNCKLRNPRVYLNSDAYPFENWQLSFDAERYGEAYQAYLNFQRSFRNKLYAEPLLDFSKFKDHALFVFDCSKFSEVIKPTPVDVKIELESEDNFPEGTRAYCVIIHDCVFTYTPLTGDVKYLVE